MSTALCCFVEGTDERPGEALSILRRSSTRRRKVFRVGKKRPGLTPAWQERSCGRRGFFFHEKGCRCVA